SLSFTATPTSKGGDGLANVGFIDSANFDLGSVTIHGDLGGITAGDNNTSATSPGVASLSVRSLGRPGTRPQAPGGGLGRRINGGLPTLTVATDIAGAFVNVGGKIGSVFVSGSILGGSAALTGSIFATGDIGSVKVMHDLVASDGYESGTIVSSGNI